MLLCKRESRAIKHLNGVVSCHGVLGHESRPYFNVSHRQGFDPIPIMQQSGSRLSFSAWTCWSHHTSCAPLELVMPAPP